MKCSDCHILIPFNITSDEVGVKEHVACYLSGCHRFEGWPLTCKRACPTFARSEIVAGGLKIMSSWFLRKFKIVIKKYQKKTKQKPKMWKDREKLVKRPWKAREKAVKNFHVWINLVWAFWSGIPYFHLWMCNQIDVHVLHLNLFRASRDWGSCSFLFSQWCNCNFFIAPKWGQNCTWK